MKINLVLLTLFLLLVSNNYGQNSVQGKAVEIIDGQTFILENSAKERYKVRLQYVEIPLDAEFAAIVKNHLNNLILNKSAEFKAKFDDGDKYIGKVVVDQVDISKQLLRDGAACFLQTNFQSAYEKDEYKQAESLAKQEKRGIWGNLKLVESQDFQKYKAEREALYNEKLKDSDRKIFSNLTPTQKLKNESLYIGMTLKEFVAVCNPPDLPDNIYSSEGYQSITINIPKTEENIELGCSGRFSFNRTTKNPVFRLSSAIQDLK